MADNKQSPNLRNVNKRLNNLNDAINNIYGSTYATRVDNKNDLNRITNGIEDNLDDLLSTVNGQNTSNISTLLIRLQRKNNNNGNKLQKSLEELVSDNSVLDSINMENIMKYIQAEDFQYDLILKYMTKLNESIEIMKDNVLSSDNFTKDFINVVANKSNTDFLNIFNSRAKKLKEKYKIQDLFEEMYLETAKYGEYFLYHVPYKNAFERLLSHKNANKVLQSNNNTLLFKESNTNSLSSTTIFESAKFDGVISKDQSLAESFMKDQLSNNSRVELYFDNYGIIPEAINEIKLAFDKKSKYSSLTESYYTESAMHEDADNGSNDFNRGTGHNLKFDYSSELANDGLLNTNNKKDNVKIKNDITGSVLYKIPRENIIPVYIGDYCVGYYYFNIVNNYLSREVITKGSYNSLTSNQRMADPERDSMDKQNDMLIGKLAADISRNIDAKFINANVDLKEEIYAILRYNDQFNPTLGTNQVTVSFLPVDDVHHFYFRLNKKTHRGVSDIEKSVVPAMLYILLYMTDIINKVSRSQDKRIYYVKQNVETNVARTMLNVINQLKKGNMGMRQLENMNTIFNVIGKYNDHIIPMGQSGDPPIQFEVMQGQQIDTPTDLMDRMEEAAVNSTDVPYEFVQSVNQVDFATRFTMSNSKFLRKVFKRQRICQEHFTKIFRKLYNFEYKENETSVEIQLPAPAFLTMTNSQQLVDNTKNFATSIAEIELGNDEELKPEFIKVMVRNYLGTYIDYDNINSMIEQARQNKSIEASKNDEGGMGDINNLETGADEF